MIAPMGLMDNLGLSLLEIRLVRCSLVLLGLVVQAPLPRKKATTAKTVVAFLIPVIASAAIHEPLGCRVAALLAMTRDLATPAYRSRASTPCGNWLDCATIAVPACCRICERERLAVSAAKSAS